MSKRQRLPGDAGLTILELMIVLVILSLIGAVVGAVIILLAWNQIARRA